MRRAGLALIVAGLMLWACSDTPGGPTNTLSLAGAWSGTWSFSSGGAIVTDNVTMTVTQTGTAVGGQWTATGGAGGTIAFTAGSEFTGTASISQTLIIGGNCSANTTISGTATQSQIKFTLGTLTPTGLCQWSTGNQFTFSK
jgi:hypothetical protein